jgi:hypothetical protein
MGGSGGCDRLGHRCSLAVLSSFLVGAGQILPGDAVGGQELGDGGDGQGQSVRNGGWRDAADVHGSEMRRTMGGRPAMAVPACMGVTLPPGGSRPRAHV